MNNAMPDHQEAIRDAVCQRRLRGPHIAAHIRLKEIYEGGALCGRAFDHCLGLRYPTHTFTLMNIPHNVQSITASQSEIPQAIAEGPALEVWFIQKPKDKEDAGGYPASDRCSGS